MKKVLIAEDDKFLASAYRLKLVKEGFEVKVAGDGVEALEMLKAFVPDIIVLDLMMPNKDGFATLKEIKEDEKLNKIPVIIASNLGQAEDVEKAKKLGAVDYIIKAELSISELIKKIESNIGS
jgi:two-component system, OmpR family, alkaline phosphatase synthesis response regulator PhoP